MGPNVKEVLKYVESWLEEFCVTLMYPVVGARQFVRFERPQSETAQGHGLSLPIKKIDHGSTNVASDTSQ